jgi:membrane protein required for colicin V production
MANFNSVDYIILGLLLFSLLAGLMRGLVKEMIALLTWVVAFAVSTVFATRLANVFTSSPKIQSAISSATNSLDASTNEPASLLAIGISFVSIFVCVLIVGKIINYFISSAIEGHGISFANRFLGAVFGLGRGVLFVLLIMFLVQLSPFSDQESWQESRFVVALKPTVKWISDIVQPGIENLKSKVVSQLNGQHLQDVQDNFKVW